MEQVAIRRGREGSRWVNERPSGEEIADWFGKIPLHDGMNHAKYVNGITLIPAKEKVNEIVGYGDDGAPIVAERQNLTYTPYMKVETRVAYFWDIVAKRDWVGTIDPVVQEGTAALGLPPGFFKFNAAKPDGAKIVAFVGYSCVVRALRVETAEWVDTPAGRILEGLPVAVGRGTKIVATATRWDADENSLMKAETGAVGRALGMAGMLVLPGSGVATAEDMQEALSGTGTGGVSPDQAALPPEAAAPAETEDPDVVLRRQAAALIGQLEAEFPAALEAFRAWSRGRGFRSLNELTSPALKGVVRKLEKTLDEAQDRSPATPESPEADLALS